MNKEKDTPEEKFIDWFKDHLMSKSLAPDQGDINKGLMLLEEARQQERERVIKEIEKKKIPDTMNGTFVREGGYNQAIDDIIKTLK